MLNTISNLDRLGPVPKLYVRSKSKFKTSIGGALTIAYFCITLGFSIYFIYLTFARKNYNVIYNEEGNKDPKLNVTENPIGLILFGNGPLGEELVSIKARYYFQTGVGFGYDDVPMRKCIYSDFDDKLLSTLDTAYYNLLTFAWCMDPESSKSRPIFGRIGQIQDQGYYGFYVNYCDNKTSECATEERMKNEVIMVKLLMIFPDYFINHANIDSPGQIYFRSITQNLNQDGYNKNFFKFRNINYNSDFGIIFPEIEYKKYHTLEDSYVFTLGTATDVAYPGNFAYLEIGMGDKIVTYSRRFDKLQTLLASIGGVVKSVLIVAHFLEDFLIKKLYLEYLLNYLEALGVKREKEEIILQRNSKGSLSHNEWIYGPFKDPEINLNNLNQKKGFTFCSIKEFENSSSSSSRKIDLNNNDKRR
jgi:hypothetical protein